MDGPPLHTNCGQIPPRWAITRVWVRGAEFLPHDMSHDIVFTNEVPLSPKVLLGRKESEVNPSASVSELLAALSNYHRVTGELSFYSEECGSETVITFFVVDSDLLHRQMAMTEGVRAPS